MLKVNELLRLQLRNLNTLLGCWIKAGWILFEKVDGQSTVGGKSLYQKLFFLSTYLFFFIINMHVIDFF